MKYLVASAVKSKVHEAGKQIAKDGLHSLDVKVEEFLEKVIKERNGGGRIDATLINFFKI